MPIDEKLLTPKVLGNTLSKENIKHILWDLDEDCGLEMGDIKEGKVRTVVPIGEEQLLMIISDHISAFNYVLNSQVYAKGANLNQQSGFFFDLTQDIVPNHILEVIHPNAWRVREAEPIRVEVVLRQYLTGSGWKDYKAADGPAKGATLYGQFFRPGYRENEKLDKLVITPTTKGPGYLFKIPEFAHLSEKELAEDDLHIDRGIIMWNYQAFHLKAPEDWERIEEIAKTMFGRISEHLRRSGLIFVDSKWEFGYDPAGSLMLIDESATCDSSRFWEASVYGFVAQQEKQEEHFMAVELSKEVVRKHLKQAGWDSWSEEQRKTYKLPDDVVKQTIQVYSDITKRATGKDTIITTESVNNSLWKAIVANLV